MLQVFTNADTVEHMSTLHSATVIFGHKPVQTDRAGVLVHLQASIASRACLPGFRLLALLWLLVLVSMVVSPPFLSSGMDLREHPYGFSCG